MSAVAQLAPWHTEFAGRLAGSVYAAPPSARLETARRLADAGLDIHIDVMAADEGLPAGVSPAEIAEIAAAVGSARLDIHLIGSPAFVDATVPDLLALAPAKIFLPWAAFTEPRAGLIRRAGSAAWIALWKEWDGFDEPHWPAVPDGVLVMLIEPGTKDRCRVERLGIVTACAPELPVIVDGGVTEDIAPLCITAGVESMVVGRALLPDPSKGDPR